MRASVVEKSSKSRVPESSPLHTITSTPAGSWAMSRAKRAWIEIMRALSIASTGRLGSTGVYEGGVQSSTTMRVAPASMARFMGTLLTTPPSTYLSPSISTGGKMAGTAEEANTASTADP
jgi:hypothetical protein